jgi:Lipid A 3-O-deacylase (PagL)
MRPRCLTLALFFCPLVLAAQSVGAPPYQIYAGYSLLSNSFNAVSGPRQPLNGWDAAMAFPAWHGLRFKLDVANYSGSNLAADQHAVSITAGGQYEWRIHREILFTEALLGDIRLNRYWGPNGIPGETASFTTLLGGGIDTPISRHFAFRVKGDFRYANFDLVKSLNNQIPYSIPGLPKTFASLSTGIVWTPKLGSAESTASVSPGYPKERPAQELVFEDLNSFGHYHVFAVTWWSYLHVAGVEYDRHSWGKFIGARMDYVAEILPVVILQQPSKTDVWGNPLTTAHETVPGLGISPVGLRMMWRDGKTWKPYYLVKGGLIGFTKKALSQDASYLDFTFQQSVGIQFRLNDRWDLRAGIGDFHFSNGFIVPSNPGIDEMSYIAALSYHLDKRKTR